MKKRVKELGSPSEALSRFISNGSSASGSSPNVRESGWVNGTRGRIGKRGSSCFTSGVGIERGKVGEGKEGAELTLRGVVQIHGRRLVTLAFST
jgi:hypothetical protein